MTVTQFRTLVTTNWLRNEIFALASSTKRPTLRILDASAKPDPAVDGYKEFYLQWVTSASHGHEIVHTLTCICTCAHAHTHTHTSTNTDQQWVTSASHGHEIVFALACRFIYAHTHTHTHAHTHVWAHTHTCMHAHVCIHAGTCIHAYQSLSSEKKRKKWRTWNLTEGWVTWSNSDLVTVI